MASTLKLRRSATQGAIPTTAQLALGELAINTYDGKLFLKKSVSGVESIVDVTTSSGGGSGSSVTIGTTAPSSPSAANLWWDSANGKLKIYYNDGNTSQWVDAATGSIGASATITLGTVTQGLPTSSLSITNSGTSGAAVFNFSIPRGSQVSLNATPVISVNPNVSPSISNTGSNGDSVYQFSLPRAAIVTLNATPVVTVNPDVSPSISNTGSGGDSIYQFSLPRAPNVTLGTVTTGAAGSSVSITDTGTNGDSVFNFTIPKGDDGTTGPSGPMGPKSSLLSYPTTQDTDVTLFYTTNALTISKIVSVLPNGTTSPSCSFNIKYASDHSTAGTAVTSSAITTTSISTGTSTTSFANASIPAGSFVWIEVTTVSGTVPALSVTMEF